MTEDHQMRSERIEKYLLGELSSSERKIFEEELTEDKLLKEEVENYRILMDAVEKQSMQEMVDEFHSEMKYDISEESRKSWVKYLAVAASLAAVLIAGFLLLNPSGNDKLYTKYYEVDPGLPTLMGETDNYSFMEGMVYYKSEDYKDALYTWEPLLSASPQNDTLNYYIGMAHLNREEYDKAFSSLSVVNPSSEFYSKALWYKALTEIQRGNQENAEKLLKQLNTAESTSLLKDLQNKSFHSL